MNQKIKTLSTHFIRCGFSGLMLEVIFTFLLSFRKRDSCPKGTTSLIMFPIYGSACLLGPLSKKLRSHCFFVRGLIYMTGIFAVELTSGLILKKKEKCPWDYSKSRWNICSVIRLDYAPYWFLTGLLFERMTKG